jgi:hypothetical protein
MPIVQSILGFPVNQCRNLWSRKILAPSSSTTSRVLFVSQCFLALLIHDFLFWRKVHNEKIAFHVQTPIWNFSYVPENWLSRSLLVPLQLGR